MSRPPHVIVQSDTGPLAALVAVLKAHGFIQTREGDVVACPCEACTQARVLLFAKGIEV
jgi:hypothetical protein